MTKRSYKQRLYPTKAQAKYLDRVLDSVRFVWNMKVENFNLWTPEFTPPKMTEKTLKDTPEHGWLNDSISFALQQKVRDFEDTKTQFFNKQRKLRLGRMKFKKKGRCTESFRIPGAALPVSNKKMCDTGRIQLPKMDPMKVVIDRPFTGDIRSITISKNKCGQYFVSILIEETIEVKPQTGNYVGIDLGFKHLFTLSNGMKVENPRWLRKNQSKLAKAQRDLSRKTRGSNRYEHHRKKKFAKLHLKVANQRKFVHHVISTWLVDNFDVIVLEDLCISGWQKTNLGKSVIDAGLSSFVDMLRYKSDWYGRTFHQIDRWFPSSKTCSECDFVLPKLGRDVDSWTCPECGCDHDRDTNAAINILYKGLNDLYGLTSAESTEYRRGEAVRPKVAIPKAASVKRLVVLPY